MITLPAGKRKAIYVDRERKVDHANSWLVRYDGEIYHASRIDGSVTFGSFEERLIEDGPDMIAWTDSAIHLDVQDAYCVPDPVTGRLFAGDWSAFSDRVSGVDASGPANLVTGATLIDNE